jgi:hypothetical protein
MYYGVGFVHSDVYTMPVYLRNFYYRELVDIKESERKQYEKSTKKSNSVGPNISRFKQ